MRVLECITVRTVGSRASTRTDMQSVGVLTPLRVTQYINNLGMDSTLD